jgi:hypothetical protein
VLHVVLAVGTIAEQETDFLAGLAGLLVEQQPQRDPRRRVQLLDTTRPERIAWTSRIGNR